MDGTHFLTVDCVTIALQRIFPRLYNPLGLSAISFPHQFLTATPGTPRLAFLKVSRISFTIPLFPFLSCHGCASFSPQLECRKLFAFLFFNRPSFSYLKFFLFSLGRSNLFPPGFLSPSVTHPMSTRRTGPFSFFYSSLFSKVPPFFPFV